jgi:hypothetical protein
MTALANTIIQQDLTNWGTLSSIVGLLSAGGTKNVMPSTNGIDVFMGALNTIGTKKLAITIDPLIDHSVINPSESIYING